MEVLCTQNTFVAGIQNKHDEVNHYKANMYKPAIFHDDIRKLKLHLLLVLMVKLDR